MKTFKLRLNMFEINHFLRVYYRKIIEETKLTMFLKIILAEKNE